MGEELMDRRVPLALAVSVVIEPRRVADLERGIACGAAFLGVVSLSDGGAPLLMRESAASELRLVDEKMLASEAARPEIGEISA